VSRLAAALAFTLLLAAAALQSQAPPPYSARLNLTIDQRMPARIYLLRNGEPFRIQPVQAVLPIRSDLFYRDRLWLETPDPAVLEIICNDEYHYLLLKGQASFHLPPGKYVMEAYRGFFYTPVRQEFELRANQSANLSLALKPWPGANPDEWLSADGHIHLTRTPRENPVYLNWLAAEDLNVANFLALQRQSDAAPQYAFGPSGQATRGPYTIRSGQETRNQRFGHILFLGARELLRPLSTGAELANQPSDYPFHTLLFDHARRAGATTGYAHFRERPRHTTLYMDLALGKLHFLELFQFGVLTTEPWYEILNAGLPIAGIAGSDFPVYLQRLKPYPRWIPLLGPERALVRRPASMTDPYAAWAQGVREGRATVTNGPLVELEISGGTATAKAAFFRPLETLEIVRNGEIVAVQKGDGARTQLTATAPARDGWFAARVRARKEKDEPDIQAHTNALFPAGPVVLPKARQAIAATWEAEIARYRTLGLVFDSAQQREFFQAAEQALAEWKRATPAKSPNP
jgi:hypothetical protein